MPRDPNPNFVLWELHADKATVYFGEYAAIQARIEAVEVVEIRRQRGNERMAAVILAKDQQYVADCRDRNRLMGQATMHAMLALMYK